MSTPLIELSSIRKAYGGGDSPRVEVLRGIDLRIHAGEFIAIVGASGSGKSTLMNILGCLDRPTSGHYHFAGLDVATLNDDELAWLRRKAFGFVFQGYHLIPSASAQENVEMPALYTGAASAPRAERAQALLKRLGLDTRAANRPRQMSGGQQQRVSIARALMNGGHIILADEPTGALDSHSGAEVMTLLEELAEQGHVVILITHDRNVAARAQRVIEVLDGEVISDSAQGTTLQPRTGSLDAQDLRKGLQQASHEHGNWLGETVDALHAAWRVMWTNRVRTALTLLGIIIGVASVVVMLAVGEGSKRQVMAQMGAFGANLMFLNGSSPTPRSAPGEIRLSDVQALAELPQIKRIMPALTQQAQVRFGNQDLMSTIGGYTPIFTEIFNWPVTQGSFFTEADERLGNAVAVIGSEVRKKLFDGQDPLGQYILIENVPFQVIGVLATKGSSGANQRNDLRIAIPYSALRIRLSGIQHPEYVVIGAADSTLVQEAEQAIRHLMLALHDGIEDFEIDNSAAMIQAEAQTRNGLSLMLGAIAAISLLVGGIGVMNVMLMTVRERTREIGIRIAVGARQRDILRQFLTEAVVLSLVGGSIGVALALLVGAGLALTQVAVAFSAMAIFGAFACAVATGVIFGFMPARKAAGLDPVVALTSE